MISTAKKIHGKNTEQGYIAVTSVIIITLLLVTVSFALSSINYFSRVNILESEYKERSYSLAQACVDRALLNLVNNSSYSPAGGGDNVLVSAGQSCVIAGVFTNGAYKEVRTQAQYQGSYTNLLITVDPANNFKTISWVECPKFTAPNFTDVCS